MEKNNIPEYDFKKIEEKWKKYWEENKINQPDLDKAKKPFYNLMMFPYPSAEGLHVGNMYAFTGADVFGRYKRMQGYDVFESIGLDGFGIHSENYAIKIKEHIKTVSDRSEKKFYQQLHDIGNMYDWSRTVETYKPEYYKWTQWLFLQMYKKGLAYQKKAKVNWCPSCKTVLSDEQVIQGQCERCDSEVEKKELKQWFFKITDYADRLLKNLEWIDWSKDVKLNQKNWIGKSEGAVIKFKVQNQNLKSDDITNYFEVFTTRPDTIFGATYMVIAPEMVETRLIASLRKAITNYDEVKKYVDKSLNKSDQERKADEKGKTGVEIKGIKAINPATKKEIPIWVADYVLGDHGTGAIMAVPAHDQRDFEFATKYKLPIKKVIEPCFWQKTEPGKIKKEKSFVERDAILAVVKHWKKDSYLGLKWEQVDWQTAITGGIKKGQTSEEAARAEILEETGYKNLKLVKELPMIHSKFYHVPKKVNRFAHFRVFYFELKDGEREKISGKEKQKHEVIWVPKKEVEKFLAPESQKYAWQILREREVVYVKDGININSDFLDGLETKEAKKKIIKWLEENPLSPPLKNGETIGRGSVDYKLRDWCISRQRYWGPPIPMIHCKKCGVLPVPEDDLPVELPEMDDFLPEGKGKGPLAKNKAFVEVKCPRCGTLAERETDVSDPFVDSAWYFLRYPSTEFNDKIFDEKRTKKWLPVDNYIGGKEHTVLHLLYSRFITMVLNDLGYTDFDEPYKKFFGHGLITKDGAKMSKSKGNVINPDEMIEGYGADAMRLYLRFLGDFSQGGDWKNGGIKGMFKFMNKLWNVFHELEGRGKGVKNMNMIDKTIKSVSEDLEKLSFNTAVARIMEFVNWIRENKDNFDKKQTEKIKKTLALIIAPLVPFIAEEFWTNLKNPLGPPSKKGEVNKDSVFNQSWPEYNPKNIIDDEIELVIQVNGKIRDKIKVSKDISEKEAQKLSLESEKIKKYIDDKEVKKIIYVEGKLINIVA